MPTLNPSTPSSQLLPWLLHEQSLTKKLRETAGDARLEMLTQQWVSPDRWDRTALKLNTASVLHREILMWAFDTPCWYARTIIPDTTFHANAVLFERLKTEPLGHLIFNGTEIQRVSLKHYMVSPSATEYAWLDKSASGLCEAVELWVRLSEFVVNGHAPFYLVEILLPGLLRYLS